MGYKYTTNMAEVQGWLPPAQICSRSGIWVKYWRCRDNISIVS